MRVFIAVAVCRLLYFFGSKLGRGSNLPGLVALRLFPDVLSRIKLPETIIAVTGSNGKTSTAELLVRALEDSGMSVGWNHEGSNQIEGIATLVLRTASFGGAVRRDVFVFETDERSARGIFCVIKPTVLLVTNLCRDQLTRNGHHEFIQGCIRSAIEAAGSGVRLVLNADDPYTAALASGDGPEPEGTIRGAASPREPIFFGVGRSASGDGAARGMYDDGAFCPQCKARMTYDYRTASHMGGYHCGACGHRRPVPGIEVSGLDLKTGEVILNEVVSARLAFPGLTGAYNLAAAIAAAGAAGVSAETSMRALDGFELTGGRTTRFSAGGRDGTLLISKHENSLSYNQSLTLAAGRIAPCTVVILVDSISRKYYTSETSWLWDVDFDILAADTVGDVVLAGRYVNELAARLTMTEVDPGKISGIADLDLLLEHILENTAGEIFAITCFADKVKLMTALR